ncbi:MAG: cytochrome-c peroxidase [Candidatus Aminicenantaceae bacterium]
MEIAKRIIIFTAVLSLVLSIGSNERAKFSPKEQLGKRLFFDTNLSTPRGQACAFCHSPEAGWTGPDGAVNKSVAIYEGAVHGRFGNRKPPSAAYAGDSPKLYRDDEGNFIGGMFWDGRASGDVLGDPLAEQAMGPFLNPLEQNNPDKKRVIMQVRNSDYAQLFEKAWRPESIDWEGDIDGTYEKIAFSIAAYERSAEVNPFSSKFDDFWRKATSTMLKVEIIDESNWKNYENMGLNENELKGLILFNTKGKCSNCHVLTSGDDKPPLFTDFTYDNLGVPKNLKNPFYSLNEKWNPDGKDWVDNGLGGYLEKTDKYAKFAAENYGKHKVPTLRNVDLKPNSDFVKAYMHNGFFNSLKDVVRFYNTRDVADANWSPPEIRKNVNKDEMGSLGLTSEEEEAIVTFMKTLTDK